MIQIDMEMPKNCLECPMWGLSDLGFMCNIKEAIVDSNMETERPDWCPLREVKNDVKISMADNIINDEERGLI
ncbi:MAG: hypothetical protein J6U09_00905 [Lachnospiraceae bacterium]|nr:hypothetical protein [Lachnospiraceae bacterium]